MANTKSKSQTPPRYNEKRVEISVVGGTLEFHPDTVPIRREKDFVRWHLVGEGKIVWIHSKKDHPRPFPKDHTYPPDGKEAVSGVVVGKQYDGLHPYSAKIKTANGTLTSDPNVQVMPPTVGPGPHKPKPKTKR
jgi:hypothetical protein